MITKNGMDYYNYEIVSEGFNLNFADKGSTYLTDKLTEYAEAFISSQKQPFCLYLCYSAPHIYLVPRGDKLKKYYSKYEKFGGKYNADYAAMIESVDDGVGRLVELLKKQNQLSNTIIIFTSDNGGVGLPELGPIPTSAGNLRKWKGHVYEGGIRVPAIFYFPSLTNGSRTVDSYFYNLDYTATIGDILKTDFSTPDGKSFLSLLRNEASFNRGRLYWHYPHFSNQMGRPAAAIRDGDYKLVYLFETEQTELFNLKTDPGEKTPVNDQNKSVEKKLKTELFAWLKSVNASFPIQKQR
jgi:arylsulfatase A-like enzyme